MPLDAPFRLGPFIVDGHGRLEPGDPGRFPSFHLSWRGCPVHARLDDGAGAGDARLRLSAVVGRVPSSAGRDGAGNQVRRLATFRALQGLHGAGSFTADLRLLPDHRMAIEAARPVALPASAGDLLTQITCFLMELGPYLDLLTEAEVPVEAVGAAVSSTAGTVKTWPG